MGARWGSRLIGTAVAVLLLGGIGFYFYERPRVTEISFVEHLLTPSPEGYMPVAPEAFPDCSRDLLEIHTEVRPVDVDLVLQPKPGVQCGIPWALESWWVDSTGQRFDPRPPEFEYPGRLLLMGKAGVKDGGGIETACEMEPPIDYFVELAGEEIEIGTIEKAECWGKRNRLRPSVLIYREGGLETPAGWLDAEIEVASEVTGNELHFVLLLTNDTGEDIVIGRCPFIDVEFVSESATGSSDTGYRTWLNCPGAPDVVEPGDTLRFNVVMSLNEESGTGRLELELRDEIRVMQRISSDPIEVVR